MAVQNKYLCLMATFDEQANRRFAAIQSEIEEAGLAGISLQPHITLAVYEGVAEADVVAWIDEVAPNLSRVPLGFFSLGLFGQNAIFASPRPSRELLDMHERLHGRFDESCGDVGKNYSLHRGTWIPHATMFVGSPPEVTKALPVVATAFSPFVAYAESLWLWWFPSATEVARWPLSLE